MSWVGNYSSQVGHAICSRSCVRGFAPHTLHCSRSWARARVLGASASSTRCSPTSPREIGRKNINSILISPKTHHTSPLLRLWGCGGLSEDNVKMNRYLVMVKFSREILVWGGVSLWEALPRTDERVSSRGVFVVRWKSTKSILWFLEILISSKKIFYKTKTFRKKFCLPLDFQKIFWVGRSSIIFFPSWFACSARAPHMLTLRVLGDRPFGAHPSHTSPPRPDAKTQTRTSC